MGGLGRLTHTESLPGVCPLPLDHQPLAFAYRAHAALSLLQRGCSPLNLFLPDLGLGCCVPHLAALGGQLLPALPWATHADSLSSLDRGGSRLEMKEGPGLEPSSWECVSSFCDNPHRSRGLSNLLRLEEFAGEEQAC